MEGIFRYYNLNNSLLFSTLSPQKASASSAAMVSDYVGYLEKGQIPPKVFCYETSYFRYLKFRCLFIYLLLAVINKCTT